MAEIIFDSEKELEDFICEYIDENKECPLSGNHVDVFERQLNLGAYGVADIVKIEIDCDIIYVTVLELKKETITTKFEHLIQKARHIRKIQLNSLRFFKSIERKRARIRDE